MRPFNAWSAPAALLTNMKTYALMAVAAIKIVRNPYELNNIKALSFRLKDSGDLRKLTEHYKRRAETRTVFDVKPVLGAISIETLRSLPEGTLGRALAKYLDDRGLDPNDLDVPSGTSDQDFVMRHLYETHDIWHVVTGFETDVAGELGLQAFYAAQAPAPLSLALLSLGLLNAFLFERADAEARLTAITDGWRRGKAARQLFGIDWKTQWDRPMAEIRRDLALAG